MKQIFEYQCKALGINNERGKLLFLGAEERERSQGTAQPR